MFENTVQTEVIKSSLSFTELGIYANGSQNNTAQSPGGVGRGTGRRREQRLRAQTPKTPWLNACANPTGPSAQGALHPWIQPTVERKYSEKVASVLNIVQAALLVVIP